MGSIKDAIRAMVEQTVSEVLAEMTGGQSSDGPRDMTPAKLAKVAPVSLRKVRSGSFPKGPRVMYHVGRRMGKRELAEMRPNDRRAYDYVVKHAPCSAAQVEAGTGLGRKATESALWSLRKGNNAGAIKSKPIA